MRYLDLFSGYGGFSLGIQQAYDSLSKTKGEQQGRVESDLPNDGNQCLGSECIGFSEIEKNAIAVYKNKFKHQNYGDITQITTLPDFDLLTGGSPCQDLSVAGKQKGLSGERSGLFFQFIRLLKEKQPANFIWENVKGTLSSQNGWDFARVQIEMAESGYGFQWQVLNAKYFGVPQSRQRVFVIGHLGGECRREIFFEQEDRGKNLKFIGSLGNTKKWNNDGKDLSRNSSQGERVYNPEGISCCQSANGGGQGAKTGLYVVGSTQKNCSVMKDCCPTLTKAMADGGGHIPMFIDLSTKSSKLTGEARTIQARYNKGYSHHAGETSGVIAVPLKFLDRNQRNYQGEYSFTVDTVNSGGVAIPEATKQGYAVAEKGDSINLSVLGSKTRRGRVGVGVAQTLDTGMQQYTYDNYKIRRLTPRECEKLMGLSVDWTKYGIGEKGVYELSDNARYKLCGNGVVVNVVEEIIKRLYE